MATMEGMVQNIVAHLEVIKLCVEVTICIGFICLVVSDLFLEIFANDTDFS